MTRNTNCLRGIRCPECANEGHFYMSAFVIAHVTDDGAEARGDMEWDGDSAILCPQCERSGKVDDFCRPAFTEEDADRLLQLGDEFLDRWEAALRRTGPDPEYEERIDEWKAIRPLLAAAPKMRDALHQIASDWRLVRAPPAAGTEKATIRSVPSASPPIPSRATRTERNQP